MIFFDFEVFKYDWLVVIINPIEKFHYVIVNDPEELKKFHNQYKHDIWVGFNSKHYDQWILKGILCGFDPKKINDYIIKEDHPGWKFSSLLRKIPLINYDVMNALDRGLKTFEGFMGNNIKESGVPFDIDRKLTEAEIDETIQYCQHDVEQTIEVFLQRKDDFEAHRGLVKLACQNRTLDLSLISKTKVQLSAIILDATKKNHNDEFDIDLPSTMRIKKYRDVVDWYMDPNNRDYEKKLEIMVAGVPHVFAWGGVHGAINQYHGEGYYLNMDVASLYPSLMIQYNLGSRNMKDPKKYEEIYHTRLQYKAEKNPLQLPLKLVLNGTYGAMKDMNNPLYDPRQANRVCIYGQLLLLDLIEKLEPYCKIIQSNTDGILIKLRQYEDYDLIDDICYEWEKRTRLQLEFDEYQKVFQKDVNNYIIVDAKGKHKSKGAYVKKLGSLDYDLPIVNKALIEYMVHNMPVEKTIGDCDELKEFQKVSKVSSKYKHALHGNKVLKEKCLRVFASTSLLDAGIFKVHAVTGRPAKIENTPEHCFIFNDEVNGVKVNIRLNKQWYIDLANKRLKDFGVENNPTLF